MKFIENKIIEIKDPKMDKAIREAADKALKEIRPILRELDLWRAKSIYCPMRLDYFKNVY